MSRKFCRAIAFGICAFGSMFASTLWADDYTPAHPLPADYTRIEFVESTGTQFVNTEYMPKATDVIRAEMCVPHSQNVWSAAFGTRDRSSAHAFEFDVHGKVNGAGADYTLRYLRRGSESVTTVTNFFNRRVGIVCNGTNLTWKPVGGGEETTLNSLALNGDCVFPLYIFGLNNGGTCADSDKSKYKLFSFRVESADGTVRRDYIPCLNPAGDAGLWDTVEGKFAVKSGTLNGYRRLSFIESDGTQYIDTGVIPKEGYEIQTDIYAYKVQASNWATAFAVRETGSTKAYEVSVRCGAGGTGQYRYLRGNAISGSNAAFYEQRISMNCTKTAMSWKPVGDENWMETLTGVKTSGDCAKTMTLFALRQGSSTPTDKGKLRIYSFLMTTAEGTPVCELVPALKSDGTIGMYDVNGYNTFRAKAAGNNLYPGCVCAVTGTVFQAYDGDLMKDDFAGFTRLEKVGNRVINAAGVTTISIPLTVAEGTFSLQNDMIAACAVTEELTLKGGATLGVDVAATECDSLAPAAVVFAGATSANPLLVDVHKCGAAALQDAPYVLISSGVDLPDGPVDFIRSTPSGDAMMTFSVANGQLLMQVNPNAVVEATWVNAGNGDIADPSNWQCLNALGETLVGALPTLDTRVILPAGCTFSCTNGAPFLCKSVIAPSSLGANCDWRGLNLALLTGNENIDLNGYVLRLSLTGATPKAFAITDANEAGRVGEVHIDVPAGATATNDKIALLGNLKLVKEGEGTFVAAKSNQTYVNGLEIVSGTAKTTLGINANKPWGVPDTTSNAITIDADGTLDVNGLYDYGHYNIILNGGTLANHGADLVNGSAKGYWCCGAVTLRANSTFDVAGSLRHNKNAESYTIDLGGKTLTVNVAVGKDFTLDGCGTYKDGTMVVAGDGKFMIDTSTRPEVPDIYDSRTMDLDLGVFFTLNKGIQVRNLTLRYAGEKASTGTGTIQVFGTYTPITDYIYNVELQNGATIDLTDRQVAVDAVGKSLSFAAGASLIDVVMPSKRVPSGEYLIRWSAKPGVRFRAKNDRASLVANDEGLRVLRGCQILFR